MDIRALAILISALILSACSPSGQSSPTMVLPGATVVLSSPIASQGASVVIQPTKSIGTPVPGWENIPIMPGAYGAELEDLVYLYSVKAPSKDVEDFYRVKMDVNGWKLTDRKAMETSSSSGPATVLDFQKNDEMLNVMLVDLEKEGATTVILSMLSP